MYTMRCSGSRENLRHFLQHSDLFAHRVTAFFTANSAQKFLVLPKGDIITFQGTEKGDKEIGAHAKHVEAFSASSSELVHGVPSNSCVGEIKDAALSFDCARMPHFTNPDNVRMIVVGMALPFMYMLVSTQTQKLPKSKVCSAISLSSRRN